MQATGETAAATVEDTALALSTVARYLMVHTGRDLFREIERLDIPLPQVKALRLIADHREPPSVGEVSDELGLSLASASRAVEGLVQRKLLTRVDSATDRRRKRVSLTAKGHRTLESLQALRLAGLREFVERLEPEEREALAHGLAPLLLRPEFAAIHPEGGTDA